MNTLKKSVFLTVTACLTLAVAAAWADFSFPAGLREIGEEAFQGNLTLTDLVIPENVTTIGEWAFANCSSLNIVLIPDSVSAIGEGAFANCGEALLIRTSPDSTGHEYALCNGIDYDANTVRRALLIGQTYTGTIKVLQGPANDMRAMNFCLAALGWQTRMQSNLSIANILSQISSVFLSATERDISLLYYSGHGAPDGSLVGKDGAELLSPAELKNALDQIPGRKIVIVDACYSGQLITEDAEEASAVSGEMEAIIRAQREAIEDPERSLETKPIERRLLTGAAETAKTNTVDYAEKFVSAFQAPFRQTLLQGALNADSYYVMTAAREAEESGEGYISSSGSGRFMGYFTNGLCLGLGYDGVAMCPVKMGADRNGDDAVSIQEAYVYAYQQALAWNNEQHAAIWPVGCRWFAPFRAE